MNADGFDLTLHLQRFDEAWHRGDLHATQSMLADETLSIDAAVELIMIDLEYRWRRIASDSLRSRDRAMAVFLEDYLAICPALAGESQMPRELILEEFRVRHRWGDEPDVSQYLQRFGTLPNLRDSLTKVLRELQVIEVQVVRDSKVVYTTAFGRALNVGRQAVREQEPFCVIGTGKKAKLVIAPLKFLEISRQQMRLSYDGKNSIRVENLSADIDLLVSLPATIPCRQIRDLELPFVIRVAYCELHLSRR